MFVIFLFPLRLDKDEMKNSMDNAPPSEEETKLENPLRALGGKAEAGDASTAQDEVLSPFPCTPQRMYIDAWGKYINLSEDARGCLMRVPGVCQCRHCLPYEPASTGPRALLTKYVHKCYWCQKQFRCVPSVPQVHGQIPNKLQACRCLVQYTFDNTKVYPDFFCSNQCFWKFNGGYPYGSVRY